jgi:hypothetical protein
MIALRHSISPIYGAAGLDVANAMSFPRDAGV